MRGPGTKSKTGVGTGRRKYTEETRKRTRRGPDRQLKRPEVEETEVLQDPRSP